MKPIQERILFSAFFVFAAIASLSLGSERFKTFASTLGSHAQAASVFFVESITVGQLHTAYNGTALFPLQIPQQKKVRILIVPGHDPESGGTAFANYTERDIASDISDNLAALLRKNPHYEVFVARSKESWNSTLSNYFNQTWTDIVAFRDAHDALMEQYLENGQIVPEGLGQVDHQVVSNETATRLYGINKWASENKIDITIHVHLNDYPGRQASAPGEYTGFAIYVPEHQYSNAEASRVIGEKIAARLNAFHATSTQPDEAIGVLEDQQLIAVGSNNTADAASMLIEYGYIYEPQFRDKATRSLAESDYAYETYLGLQDFFNDPVLPYGSSLLPYTWSGNPTPHSKSPDMYALQTALHTIGLYPPMGKSFSDCPISGYFGDCTTSALIEVQRSQGIPQTGLVDRVTRLALPNILGGSIVFGAR